VSENSGTLIFVYGTLKRGCSNHHFLHGQTFVGAAVTRPGYRLFSLGDYPGMVRWDETSPGVHGEIWQVEDACLHDLDVLEGVADGLYRRVRVPLLAPFDHHVVLTYLYALSIEGRTDLGSVWVS
jgi:gamma-glutamylaminecyclotransferase